ncbi:WD40-repeat-containing domain protein [Gamsiella multidivaricata]|uniref:WD40-repeat-containing domain protein n=1 Tax=Gamsiella multidivaricata TaxID=101098 RepID=UPI00221EC23A|nr:WD40-repeat-containing domain protein [Gamsiella multidivaricata]KAI7815862.1 WD40-repeat-containing domain protein [Gamsiella multidivaricata]
MQDQSTTDIAMHHAMDTAFPPSPQWYQPQSACLCYLSENTGWLLYSLNNAVHILNPFTLKYNGALQGGHSARVNAIAARPATPFCSTEQEPVQYAENLGQDSWADQKESPEPRRVLVATAGEDSTVVCWDVATRRALASLKKTHTKGVKVVEWTSDGRYIVSGDSAGVVAVWSPFDGKMNRKTLPEKPGICCMSASPTCPDTVAIGLEGGDILICQVNLTYIVVLRRLNGHTSKIHSMSWQQPSAMQDQGYTLLASGAADQTIRIWDVEKEATAYVFPMPEVDHKLSPQQRSKLWVPVGWVSKGRDIISCTSRQRDPGKIAMGLGCDTIKVWNTLSQEEPYESVMVERMQSKVRTVKWHPVEEGTLCFGLESGKIGMVENIYGPNPFGNGQHEKQGKKGKQGKQDIGKVCQKMTTFQSYHEGAITSIAWCSPKAFEAPVPELFDLSLRDSSFCIVSCGSDGKILISDSTKPTNKSLDLKVVLQRQNSAWYQSYSAIKGLEAPWRRDFAIHPNEDLIAIGNGDGSVEVFELKHFKLVYVFQGHTKRVNRVKWECSVAGAGDGSTERIATSSSPMMVDTNFVLPTTQAFAIFRCHNRGISDLTWSPHGYGSGSDLARFRHLVSASYDGKAIVYQIQLDDVIRDGHQLRQIEEGEASNGTEATRDLSSQVEHKVVACFSGHVSGQILSVHWSMTEIDQIYSGGQDWRLCVWDWRSHPFSDRQLSKEPLTTHKGALKDVAASSSQDSEAARVKGANQSGAIVEPDDLLKPETQLGQEQKQMNTPSSMGTVKQDDRTMEDVESVPRPPKRESDTSLWPEATVSKRTRTKPKSVISSVALQPPRKFASETDTELVNLFPASATAFQFNSKEKVHLEIIRLARNLYCRRVGQGGCLEREEEVEAARIRWLAMLGFFEKDGEKQGVALSHILGSDVDEMNLGDKDEKGQEDQGEHVNQSRKDSHLVSKTQGVTASCGASEGSNLGYLAVDHHSSDTTSLKTNARSQVPEAWQGDDCTASSCDLVFYGSRESIKALAEMETEELAKKQSQRGTSIFRVGGGLGVLPLEKNSSTPPSQASLGSIGQLSQIPVSYWLGDVPKVADILDSLPDSELGIQDWIGIALSPMGGAGAWRYMMTRTAAKFAERGEVHAAALCYLGIGRVAEAVDVYRRAKLYREALMLLRIRLWDDDDDADNDGDTEGDGWNEGDSEDRSTDDKHKHVVPWDPGALHIQILTEWGREMERLGQYEKACKCQLTLASILARRMRRNSGDQLPLESASKLIQETPSVGLQTLARRGDVTTLRTVAGLAILLRDPSCQERILRYEAAIAQKREADRVRKGQHQAHH